MIIKQVTLHVLTMHELKELGATDEDLERWMKRAIDWPCTLKCRRKNGTKIEWDFELEG